MPSGSRWDRWLGLLGRFLPARIRERVFEPACYDLAFEHLRGPRGIHLLGARMFAILLYVAGANFPGVLFENRRLSRLGLLIASLAVLSAIGLIGLRLALSGQYEST